MAIRQFAADAGAILIVATTRFVAGSIRETLGAPLFTTHTAPGETAIASGCAPTLIRVLAVFECGSTRTTTLSPGKLTHTAPSPAAASPHDGVAGHECLKGN